jgi:hypothetical protein
MSGQTRPTWRKGTRALTWTCFTLVPALAIVALGYSLRPAAFANTPAVPGGLLVAETRAFAAAGDDVSAVNATAAPAAGQAIDEFMDGWQNTVRRRPSPRR